MSSWPGFDLNLPVIPGHREAMNPESRGEYARDSGFGALRRSGMTPKSLF
jgi:hypothetical protein